MTEKEKMLSGLPYNAWDDALEQERIYCRYILRELNFSIPETPEWRTSISKLMGYESNAHLEPPFRCDYGYNIKVGKNFYTNFNCVFLDVAPITIGDDVLLGPNVQLYTVNHPIEAEGRIDGGVEFGKPIKIGNRVWIGGGSIILPGVTIGDNTVIGSGSVVTKDIPANVVAVGNPCKVIKQINNQ
ncbi:sugar O-acetyltransferase [Photobacterium satsumensis]|uniref:sugar O-acetyltransferase n=1 Tax=Photobacterium satsumensis TaxID=2910239 RepID=UPI003D098788